MNKPKQGGKVWLEALRCVVLSHCPIIVQCCGCGLPAREGYVCCCGYDGEDQEDDIIYPQEWM